MKRTTKPTGNPTPSKEQALRALTRTSEWLRNNNMTSYPGGEESIAFQEPLWKGWVLGFHHEGEMFLCIPFREHTGMVYKITPAGFTMLTPPIIQKQTLPKRRKLAQQKGFSL
jgi:hypothetical protein